MHVYFLIWPPWKLPFRFPPDLGHSRAAERVPEADWQLTPQLSPFSVLAIPPQSRHS
jgi:hypothetical protein